VIVRAGDLQPEGLLLGEQLELEPLGYDGGLEIGVVGAAVKARILPSRGGLVCSGRLEATALVPCSRCLEPYSFPVARDFDLVYLPPPQDPGEAGQELQITRDDLDVAYLTQERELDLNGLAAEQIYLALPMKPLCSEECRGLCQFCGCNLNTELCRCSVTA
jgi:uncharacterized protein